MKKRLLTNFFLVIICLLFVRATELSPVFAFDKTSFLVCVDGVEIARFVDEEFIANNHIEYEEIRERGINLNAKEKREVLKNQLKNGKSIKQAVDYCFPKMKEFISTVVKKCYVAPKESEITFYPNEKVAFKITKDKAGKRVDGGELYEKIARAIESGESKISVKSRVVEPTIKVEDNEKLTYRRAVFATDASNSTAERKHNIALALNKINGSVIKNDEEFSFNETVGKRNEENGYKTAKIIMDGKYVDGIGGGVCQASTTLYNGALLADLSIKKVYGHSLRPSYVAPSFDAMVNSSSSDLVIKNETGGTVFIHSYFKKGKAIVEIYGLKNEYKIERKSVTTYLGEPPQDEIEEEETDVIEEIGSEIRVSYSQGETKSEGYLVYYKDGIKVGEKLIRKDGYRKKAGKIIKKVESKKII